MAVYIAHPDIIIIVYTSITNRNGLNAEPLGTLISTSKCSLIPGLDFTQVSCTDMVYTSSIFGVRTHLHSKFMGHCIIICYAFSRSTRRISSLYFLALLTGTVVFAALLAYL